MENRSEHTLSNLFKDVFVYLLIFFNLVLFVQKSFKDLEKREAGDENGGFKLSLSSRERRARRKAEKQAKS